jgi:hypothetical protein
MASRENFRVRPGQWRTASKARCILRGSAIRNSWGGAAILKLFRKMVQTGKPVI